jgi:hypothetical protein
MMPGSLIRVQPRGASELRFNYLALHQIAEGGEAALQELKPVLVKDSTLGFRELERGLFQIVTFGAVLR